MLWGRIQSPGKLKDPEFSRPTPEAVVNLFAELSEPADIETVTKTFSDDAGKNGSIYVCTYTETGRLAGFLRAWRGPDPQDGRGGIPGIVYDIAVSGRFRGKDVARHMLASLQEHNGTKRFTGNPARVAPTLDRALTVIRTVYAISLILGYQKLIESGYSLMFGGHPGWPGWSIALLYWILFVLAVLGFRFFWAVGNIRRLVLRRIYELRPVRRVTLLLIHLPLLFSHAVLLYFLCRIVQDLFPPHGSIDTAHTRGFGGTFCVLMLVNVIWLWRLVDKRNDRGPEKRWFWNNAVCGIATFITLGVCAYYHISNEWTLFFFSAIVAVNNLVDLLSTEDTYILSDAFAGG